MQLKAGQRYRLKNENKFAYVNSGKIEVYAVTRDTSNFRQICLMELTAGGAAYPSFDDLEIVDILIYAVEESEIELIGFNEVAVENQKALMRSWFNELAKIIWLNLLADGDDKTIIQWRDGSLFSNCDSLEILYTQFLDNEQIFSSLTGVQFKHEDTRFTERLKVRSQDGQLLIDNSINRLPENGKVTSPDQLNETVFIVREVAKALSMNTENISISPEFVQRLDQVGIIRRLRQYANTLCNF